MRRPKGCEARHASRSDSEHRKQPVRPVGGGSLLASPYPPTHISPPAPLAPPRARAERGRRCFQGDWVQDRPLRGTAVEGDGTYAFTIFDGTSQLTEESWAAARRVHAGRLLAWPPPPAAPGGPGGPEEWSGVALGADGARFEGRLRGLCPLHGTETRIAAGGGGGGGSAYRVVYGGRRTLAEAPKPREKAVVPPPPPRHLTEQEGSVWHAGWFRLAPSSLLASAYGCRRSALAPHGAGGSCRPS
jgi:hypothetical protein